MANGNLYPKELIRWAVRSARKIALRRRSESRRLASEWSRENSRWHGLEGLEPRILLSTTITDNQRDALHDGLDALVNQAAVVENFVQVAQALPFIDRAVGPEIDIDRAVQEKVVDPLFNAANGLFATASNALVDEVVLTLESIPGVSEVVGHRDDQELRFDVFIEVQRDSLGIPLNLGANALSLGLDADASATLDLETNLLFDLSFGLDLTDGAVDSDDFFIRSSDGLILQAAITTTDLNIDLNFGFIDLVVDSGSVDLDAELNIQWLNPDADAKGNISFQELQNTDLTDLLAISTTGQAEAVLPVDSTLLPFAIGGDPTITLSTNDLFNGQSLQVDFNSDFDPVGEFNDSVAEAILDGLSGLADFGDDVDSSSALSTQIPLLGKSVGDLVDVGGILRDRVLTPIEEFINSGDKPTTAQFIEALKGLGGTGNDVDISLDPTSITGGLTGDELVFDLVFTATRTDTVSLDLGEEVADTGMSIEGSLETDVVTTFDFDVSFGVDINSLPSLSEAFFIRFNSTPTVSALIDTDSLAIAGQLGFLGLGIENGSVDLAASAMLDINDPNSDNRLTLSELQDTSLGSLLNLSSVSSLIAVLPIVAQVGSHDFAQGVTPQITYNDADLFDDVTPSPQFEDFDELLNFNNISAAGMLGALRQVSNWFGDLTSSPVFDTEIPFTDGTTLGDVLNFSDAFVTGVLGDAESSDDPDSPSFGTAQEFAQMLASVGSVDYDPVKKELVFDLDFSKDFDALSTDLAFDFDLGDLGGLSTSSTIGVRPSVSATTTLGVLLTPLGDGFVLEEGRLLSSLNAGNGVMIEPGVDDLEIRLGDATTFNVNFDGAITIDDVLDALNNAAPGAGVFLARINDDQTGLTLEDLTGGTAVEFKVTRINDSLAGISLGISGMDMDGNGVIESGALHGDSLLNHVYLRDPTLEGTVEIFADDIDAMASFGFVGVGIEDGSVVGQVTTSLTLDDPGITGFDNRITVRELFGSLSGIAASLEAENDAPADGQLGVGGTLKVQVGDDASVTLVVPQNPLNESVSDLARDINLAIAGSNLDGIIKAGSSDNKLTLFNADGVARKITIVSASDAFGFTAGQSGYVARPSLDGAVEFDLPISLDGGFPGLSLNAPNLHISLPDINFPDTIDIATINFDELFDLRNLSLSHIIAGLREALAFAIDLEALDEIDITLPVLDVNLADIIAFSPAFDSFLGELELVAGGNLQGLEETIEDLLGIDDTAADPFRDPSDPDEDNRDSPKVTLSLDTSNFLHPAVRLDLLFEEKVTEELPVSIDLADQLNIPGVSDIIDVSGGGLLTLEAGAGLDLSLGLDLSDPLSPDPFLYDETTFSVFAKALGTDITFDAAVGPLGLFVRDGEAGINRDGPGSTAPSRV